MASAQVEEENDNINEELAKIKGDAIGDTVYSERWVLKTLIRLSKIEEEKWGRELEEELQLLWDMTAEKDVAIFLSENDFLSLCHKTILYSNVPRLTEIVIGILGNLCCEDIVKSKLSACPQLCSLLIEQLQSQDSLILVQLLRLLNTCLWPEREDSLIRYRSPPHNDENEPNVKQPSSWLEIINSHFESVVQCLIFFLNSATNEELLCSTLELFDTLLSTKLNLPQLIISKPEFAADLSEGLAESLWQLLRGVQQGDSVTDTRRLIRGCRVWVSVIGVLASSELGRNHLEGKKKQFVKCFIKLLDLFLAPEALLTHKPELPLNLLSLLECLPKTPLQPSVLVNLIKAVYNLHSGLEATFDDDEEPSEALELLQRTAQYVRIEITLLDDLERVLTSLSVHHLAYLENVLQPDDTQIERLQASLLSLRTNGLVQ